MKHISLFTGIGGFDLAAEWMGWENILQVENNNYCLKILNKNFPNVKKHKDIRDLDGKSYRGTEKAKRITDTSGLKCLELLKRSTQFSLWQKTFTDCLLSTMVIQSKESVPTWKLLVTKSRSFLIVRLMPLIYQRWNGTYGLLPRPLASDRKGAKKTRTRTTENLGYFREVIREKSTDGIYPNPEFVIWLKGFPEGWLL